MIRLLCRLYAPEGEIPLKGADFRKFRQEEYIRLFSVVFQDLALAWVNILCDGELWITLSAVGIFVGKVVLEAALTGYYGSRM